MAKRINTPFVATVAITSFLAVSVVMVGPRIKHFLARRIDPRMIEKERHDAMEMAKNGHIREAVELITTAYIQDRTNKELCVERGDILAMLTELDGQAAMDKARASWSNALEIDPQYKPAARRLLDSYVEQMDIAPSVQVCQRLRDAAGRYLQIDPGDSRAAAYFQIATVQEWVQGTPKTEQEVTQSLDALGELLKKNPSADEVLFYLVRGKTFRASDFFRTNRADVGNQLLADCRSMLTSAVTTFPKNASVNFRAFQGFAMLADSERDHALAVKDRAAADEALNRARTLVTEDDPRNSDYQYVASDWARRNGRNEESEKILRDFYNKHKTDQRAAWLWPAPWV